MSNVKPGDLARFVKGIDPPEFEGAQCLVIGPFRPTNAYERRAVRCVQEQHGLGPLWEVELLQHVSHADGYEFICKQSHSAGDCCGAHDRYLRRIDPPAGDNDELFSSEPTLEESLEQLEKVHEFVTR